MLIPRIPAAELYMSAISMTEFKKKRRVGVLISNLGTPQAATTQAVKSYLAEFLSDPYVVKLPRLIWWPILHGIILRTRPSKSAALYQKIWLKTGSPLFVITSSLLKKLAAYSRAQGVDYAFALGMRYGEPSIQTALLALKEKNITDLIVLPLYPQYSMTTTASTMAEVEKQLNILRWEPTCSFIQDYHLAPAYIEALADRITQAWQEHTPGEKLLFSFHGIPKSSISQGDPYYHQCLSTASAIAQKLKLDDARWQVVFQSRFGKQAWLEPDCVKTLATLALNGCQSVDIVCPGFAVDCLETLEEIAITNKKIFLEAGGHQFNYIQALNDDAAQIRCLWELLNKTAP